MLLLLAVALVLLVPIAFVAMMLARASSILDSQDDADMERYRELGPEDIGRPSLSVAATETGG